MENIKGLRKRSKFIFSPIKIVYNMGILSYDIPTKDIFY